MGAARAVRIDVAAAQAARLEEDADFLEGLERALDACEDVGGALRAVIIKNA